MNLNQYIHELNQLAESPPIVQSIINVLNELELGTLPLNTENLKIIRHE